MEPATVSESSEP